MDLGPVTDVDDVFFFNALSQAHVRAILIKRRTTQEGEVIPIYQYDLQLGSPPGETEGRLFMVWPVIVEHRIDEDSPFWDLSADKLANDQFELVVVLEGWLS